MRIRSPQQLRRAQRSRDPVGTHARAGTNQAVLILEPVGRTILEGAGSTKKATREEYALRRTGARQGLHDEGSVSILCTLVVYPMLHWLVVPRAASITRRAFLAGSTSPSRLPRLVLTRFMVHGPLKSRSRCLARVLPRPARPVIVVLVQEQPPAPIPIPHAEPWGLLIK